MLNGSPTYSSLLLVSARPRLTSPIPCGPLTCDDDGQPDLPSGAMSSCPMVASAITRCDSGSLWRRARSRRSAQSHVA